MDRYQTDLSIGGDRKEPDSNLDRIAQDDQSSIQALSSLANLWNLFERAQCIIRILLEAQVSRGALAGPNNNTRNQRLAVVEGGKLPSSKTLQQHADSSRSLVEELFNLCDGSLARVLTLLNQTASGRNLAEMRRMTTHELRIVASSLSEITPPSESKSDFSEILLGIVRQSFPVRSSSSLALDLGEVARLFSSLGHKQDCTAVKLTDMIVQFRQTLDPKTTESIIGASTSSA
ncbi:MAG: hypothetical protein M1816_002233 [Peltula sp. TS41687]|nr:MAG: hypothetical protein M1816_002233 [Peltula sp. TS41687]